MSIGSISFWQQDRLYWNQAAARDQSLANSSQVISTLGTAMTSLSSGLAGIANQTALNRIKTQLSAAVQNALDGTSGSSSSNNSSSSSSASSSSSSSGSSAPSVTLATGTGTTPLAAGTSLLTLGIVKKGTITVSDGTNTTTYTSTGTDTVADLINTVNVDGKAKVTASLNSSGELVFTADSSATTIAVGGLYAANIGFGAGNDIFQPTTAISAASSATGPSGPSNTATSSASGGHSSTNASSTGPFTQKSSGSLLNSAFALQTVGTAETLLSSNGLTGSLLNMLA